MPRSLSMARWRWPKTQNASFPPEQINPYLDLLPAPPGGADRGAAPKRRTERQGLRCTSSRIRRLRCCTWPRVEGSRWMPCASAAPRKMLELAAQLGIEPTGATPPFANHGSTA